MDSLVDQTLAAMERECDLYGALLALAEEQRTCLVKGAAPRLEEIVAEQSDLLRRAAHASRRVESHVGLLGRSLQLPGGPRGADLAQALPAEAAARYQGLRRRLLSMADDLRRLGQINQRLAIGALGYIDFSLRLIGGVGDGCRPYAHDGSPPAHEPGRLVLDTRV
jgi:hypothetical protein